ncbi:MAG: lipoyl synthase [Candidatus Eremiobacteraeota bacterium]|nr:lipoyl synthase [Candidatus Eremiobacteraeota bacterium]
MTSQPDKAYIPLRIIGVEANDLAKPRDPHWKDQPQRPDWLRIRLQTSDSFGKIKGMMGNLKLHTVCEEARCPNIYECWSDGTATFMVMGDTCTRACGFCNVKTGRPEALDIHEPQHVAEAVQQMGLDHAVITSVDRDDLPDGGAQHIADTIEAVRKLNPNTKIEVLIPDFQGDWDAFQLVLNARPDVLNHNTETVPRLYKRVRNRADYQQTLDLLRRAHEWRLDHFPGMLTKSGIMVGLGESSEEVEQTIADIRAQKTDVLTVGQYMRPTMKHLPVERYWSPEEFSQLRDFALNLGFRFVEAGPLVRSSYHAKRHRVD